MASVIDVVNRTTNSQPNTAQPKPPKIYADNRPNDYEYALISQHVYGADLKHKLEEGAYFYTGVNETVQWEIIKTTKTNWGYFGAIYICHQTKQIVVAHRGTNSIKDIIEDIRGIFFNKCTPQKIQALAVTEEAIKLVKSLKEYYHLSFTGHSLGAFLAEISVFHASLCLEFPDVNAVTFESPGSSLSFKNLECIKMVKHFELQTLDIVSYVCYPNVINACNQHVGTVYSINVDLGAMGWWPGFHLLKCHSIDGIVEWFRRSIVDNHKACQRLYMSDWPVGSLQTRRFYKHANFNNGLYTLAREFTRGSSLRKELHEAEEVYVLKKFLKHQEKKFDLRFRGNFKVYNSLSSYNVMPLHHFSLPMQDFLHKFYSRMQFLLENNRNHQIEVKQLLTRKWEKMKVPDSIIDNLIHLSIKRNKIAIEEIHISDKEKSYVSKFRRDFSNWLQARATCSVEEFVPSHLTDFDVITTHPEHASFPESRNKITRRYSF